MKKKYCKVCGELLETEDEMEQGVCRYCEDRRKIYSEKIVERESICVNLHHVAPAYFDDYDYLETTTWANGEGVDINIYKKDDGGEKHYSFSIEEMEAIHNCLIRLGFKPFDYVEHGKDNEE